MLPAISSAIILWKLSVSFFLTSFVQQESPWYDRVLTGMETGPTGAHFGHSDPTDSRYAASFDGAEIVRQAVAANSEYLVMWVRDGDYAYYQSKLLPKAPGLAGRDPLREAMDEAAKSRLPIIAYCVVQQGGHFLTAHPEWQMRDANGQPIGRFCYNSGYLEALKQMVAEQLEYGIAGFHIDMVDQGFGTPYGCWCESCRRQFEQEYSRPMPTGPTWDDTWDKMLEFRYRSSERLEQLLAAHIRALDPRATVDFNYHGNPPFSFEVGQRPVQHARNGDFITGETGVWGFSALTVGLNVQFYRAAVPDQRVQVAMQRGVRMYHDQTTRPLNDLRWELLTLLSHGAFVTMVDKTGFDGRLDPMAYERTGAAFAEAQAKRSHFGHMPIADVGIYFSSRTRDWVGRDKPAEWFPSFLGAHKALAYEHIPYGIVLDENATVESVRRYPVLLVPNPGIVSEREVEMFREYVTGGGKLIFTGLPGCYDRLGEPIESSSLETLIGGQFVQRLDSLDNWLRFLTDSESSEEEQAAMARGLRRDWPFLVKGPAAVWKPTTASALGQVMKPYRSIRQQTGLEGTDWPMSAEAPVGPAILRHKIGAGEVLTFAVSPDYATASEHHVVEARRLLTAAIDLLHPTPRVRVTAPATVESIVTDDPASRTLRIHLLGYNGPPQTLSAKERPYVLPALMEDAPTFRATIELQHAPESVSTFNSSTTLKLAGNKIDVVISDVHDVVILKY
ncbi:MAG: hypothetical protein JNL67_14065 [Planctomycetaceae bacterium]|nr:hypothetical protein [Planctomycetaceae bacterium]